MAEILKLIYATGLKTGLTVFFKKNGSAPSFSLTLPAEQGKIIIRRKTSDWSVFKQVFVWKEYSYQFHFPQNVLLMLEQM